MSIIGELLRLKRLEKGYTLEGTAKEVGVSINYISKLEKGDNSNPSDKVIIKLAETLDLDEDRLFSSFGKIPISARSRLENNPIFANAFSQIKNDKNLSEESQEILKEKFIYWYKKLAEEEK